MMRLDFDFSAGLSSQFPSYPIFMHGQVHQGDFIAHFCPRYHDIRCQIVVLIHLCTSFQGATNCTEQSQRPDPFSIPKQVEQQKMMSRPARPGAPGMCGRLGSFFYATHLLVLCNCIFSWAFRRTP